jgi:hypothetical protein
MIKGDAVFLVQIDIIDEWKNSYTALLSFAFE